MKKCFLYCLLSAIPLQHFAQETTVSLPEMDLADEYYFDNWIYGADTFFVAPIQLSEFAPFVEFQFNISYDQTLLEPFTANLTGVNADDYIMVANYMGFANFAMINDGNLNTEVFSVSGNQSMLSVSFTGDSATTSLYNSCNGNLMYLAFKKVAPCYEGPIFLEFWNGDLGEEFVNENQTTAFSMQSAAFSSTEDGSAYAIDGEVVLNLIHAEVIQNSNMLEAIVSGGTPPYTYQWEDKAGNVLNENSFFSPSQFADYILTATDVNGCSYFVYASFEEVSGVGENKANLSVFPNPVQTQFQINFVEAYQYQLMDITGKIVRQGVGEQQTVIQRGVLPKGIYILSILTDDNQIYEQLIFE
jgi:hypothetical protein